MTRSAATTSGFDSRVCGLNASALSLDHEIRPLAPDPLDRRSAICRLLRRVGRRAAVDERYARHQRRVDPQHRERRVAAHRAAREYGARHAHAPQLFRQVLGPKVERSRAIKIELISKSRKIERVDHTFGPQCGDLGAPHPGVERPGVEQDQRQRKRHQSTRANVVPPHWQGSISNERAYSVNSASQAKQR